MSTDALNPLRIVGLVVIGLTVAGLSAVILSFTSHAEGETDHVH